MKRIIFGALLLIGSLSYGMAGGLGHLLRAGALEKAAEQLEKLNPLTPTEVNLLQLEIEREKLVAEQKIKEAEQKTKEAEIELERQRKDTRDKEAQAHQEQLDREARAHQEQLEREQEAEQRKHDLEEESLGRKLELEVAAEAEKAKAKAEKQKALDEHKINQWNDLKKRRTLQAMAKAESQRRAEESVKTTRAKFEAIKQSIFEFTDHPDRMKKTGKVIAGTVVVAAAGVLTVKHALPIVRQMVENYLFTPTLIEESSYNLFGSLFARRQEVPSLDQLYFDAELQAHVQEIKTTLSSTKENNGYYLNYLFYGPPGTGKTATARALAYESGMDFAFMTGGSVLDLLRTGKAIQRLKEVFEWAQKSKKGLILFIDEADAFLSNPNGSMSEELNSVLKAFLNYTGTESKNFTLILSTNHPNQLSKAVLNRIGFGQQLRFDLPTLEARKQMVQHFMQKYLAHHKTIDAQQVMNAETFDYIAQQTHGFAGRPISYLILGLEKAALVQPLPRVDKILVEKVVTQAVTNYKQAQQFVSLA